MLTYIVMKDHGQSLALFNIFEEFLLLQVFYNQD